MKKARLILENGLEFAGTRFGADGESIGEIVFTTAMTGYIETLTDPSYFGQIVVQTFPLIGNAGMISEDFESSRPALRAYIVREWCQDPSNFRNEGVLDAFLKENNIVGLYDLDTRALTRILREHGVMNACITSSDEAAAVIAGRIKDNCCADAVASVGTSVGTKEILRAPEGEGFHVVLWDFGAKQNIRRKLERRGCRVTVVPHDTTADEIMALRPDGIVPAGGPGDPAENTAAVEQLGKLCKTGIPIFGICLGHQLLALSQGAKTEKLKYGHRGASQPVKDVVTGRVYITSQNHGYAVVSDSLPSHAELRFVNANDGTNEGIFYNGINAFSVQFHPETSAGALDTGFLFDRFVELMKGEK